MTKFVYKNWRWITLFLLFFNTSVLCLFAQSTHCVPDNTNTSPCRSDISPPSLTTPCALNSEQLPYMPIKTIRVVFHVFQQESPLAPENFTEDHLIYLEAFFNDPDFSINANHANLCNSDPDLSDSRLRFELDKVFFWQDNAHWDNGHYWCYNPNTQMWTNNFAPACSTYDQYISNNPIFTPEQQDALHVLFFDASRIQNGNILRADGGFASSLGPKNGENYMVYTGQYTSAMNSGFVFSDDRGNGFTHEISLLLSNRHDYGNIPSFMSHGGTPRCLLTELEIMRLHYFLEGNCINNECLTVDRAVIEDNCIIEEPPIVIDSGVDVLWNGAMQVRSDIIVKPGGKLTVTCKIGMPSGGKVIVEKGGHLVVDGGTFTKNCDDYWQGIEVWGNPNLAQTTQNQGFLVLKNNATIEYANNAISVSQNSWGTTGGGIVNAVGAKFINNKRSVEFTQYSQNNKSIFQGCRFELNSDYELSGFLQHVSMWKVIGVSFSACDFINNSNVTDRKEGIYSLDAGYSAVSCTFDGFRYGINSRNQKSMNTFKVTHSDFQDNSVGVYAGAVSGIEVIENTFNIGQRPFTKDSSFDLLNHGVIVEVGTGYFIEDNIFTGVNSTRRRTGVLIKNTGDESNQVFRNDFAGLEYGNLSNGDNRNNDFSFLGLEYICNENVNNTLFDFAVPAEYNAQGNPINTTGISENQGSPQKAAGNTFSNTQGTTGSDFYNQSPWTIRYWYNPTPPTDVINVLPQYGSPNNCDDGRTDDPKEDYAGAKTEYDLSKTTYDARLDGGDTQALIAEINEGGNRNAGPLFQRLKALSPYLSTEVLEVVADRPDLIHHQQMVILLARNPDALSPILEEYIASRPNPMPFAMLQEAFSHRYERTERTEVQEQMGRHRLKMHDAANRVLRNALTTVEDINFEEVHTWLGKKNNLRANYDIVETYLQQGMTAAAIAWVETIPNNYRLSPKQQIEHDFYKSLKEIQVALINSGRNDQELNETEITTVQGIAENSQGLAGVQARNWLNTDYGQDFVPITIYPTEEGFNPLLPSSPQQHQLNNNDNIQVNAYPNPANEQISFQLNYPAIVVTARLEITDINGRLIEQLNVPQGLHNITWDIPTALSGVYLYRLILDDVTHQTQKLIIIR